MIKNFKDKITSTIIKLEIEMTEALINGHKAADNDKFAESRLELKKLREELGIKENRQNN